MKNTNTHDNEIGIDAIVAENKRRNEALRCTYDPVTGVGCYGTRVAVERHGKRLLVPEAMARGFPRRLSAAPTPF